MPRFKNVNGETIQLTADEENARAAAKVREKRDELLAATDWMANSDVTLADNWKTYRQALRDITSQAGFPNSVTYPTEPS